MNIKQSFRIIFRNKTYSLLNIVGLAVGITAAALILLWVEYQINFNKTFSKSDYIYQIGQHQRYGDEVYTFFVAQGPLSRTLDESFPEIKRNSRYSGGSREQFFKDGEQKTIDAYGVYADSMLFSMLSMNFVEGSPQEAFKQQNNIVLSKRVADALFKGEKAVGEMVENKSGGSYVVGGVFEDMPQNSSFRFGWVAPFDLLEQFYRENNWADVNSWTSNWLNCFVELNPNADVAALNEKLGMLVQEKTNGDSETQLFVYPQKEMHLYGDFKDGKPTGSGYIKTVRLFFLIGVLILLIACVNYMNLATARSEKRALEVGVRKAFGGCRFDLIRQFLGESALITGISLLLALGLIFLCMPAFNRLVYGNLTFDFFNPYHLFGLLAVGVVCTCLAGGYPAFYLSSFSPMKTLKKAVRTGSGSSGWVRKILVVFQFAASFVLICTTLVIFLQIRHGQNRPLGFNKDNLMLFPVSEDLKERSQAVRNEVLRVEGVEQAGFTSNDIVQVYSNGGGYQWPGKREDFNPLVSSMYVGAGFLEAAGFTMLDGAPFSEVDDIREEDRMTKVVVNRTLAEMMGEAGKVGGFMGNGNPGEYHCEIGGIIDDFVYNDIYAEKPAPLIIFPFPQYSNYLLVRYKEGEPASDIQMKVKHALQSFNPNNPYDAFFVDDTFHNMFGGQRQTGSLAALFAALAIFISCLGLFGLSAFSAEQRNKEIGIRKVLGASVGQILYLLGRSFMLLIVVALVVAIPVSWYFSNRWLQGYAYKIDLSWTVFAGTALLVTLIALITISVQSVRAATANPVKSIKSNE